MPAKVLGFRRTTLRVDERIARAAELIARLEGVSVAELIEALLFDFANRGFVDEPLGEGQDAAAARRASAQEGKAEVVSLDDARRRRRPDSAAPARPMETRRPLRERVEAIRRRAAMARERARQACGAAQHARLRAQQALAALRAV